MKAKPDHPENGWQKGLWEAATDLASRQRIFSCYKIKKGVNITMREKIRNDIRKVECLQYTDTCYEKRKLDILYIHADVSKHGGAGWCKG